MPTGYTYKIEEGCTFPEFIWGCARAFGALISMRDSPADEPVPEKLEPAPYYLDAVNEARGELARLDFMTDDEVRRRICEEREEAEADNRRYREDHAAKKAKYLAMRRDVDAWVPPTADHVGLKRFMLDQIEISMPCDPCYQRELPIAEPAEWIGKRRTELLKNLIRSMEEWKKEVERTDSRNEWLQQLRQSIPPVREQSWRDREPQL
jgi:hypothetical protein